MFSTINVARALTTLRFILGRIGVDDFRSYRTHDLRRGHILDLQKSGAPLSKIIQEAQWKPPAFMKYVDGCLLEYDAVVQAHMDNSSSESGSDVEGVVELD
jgi:hypothetical protein